MDGNITTQMRHVLMNADLRYLEELCKDEKFNKLCDEKFWEEKLAKDYKLKASKSPKAVYYRQINTESFKAYTDLVTKDTSLNPVLQEVLNRRKELLKELSNINNIVSKEVNNLVKSECKSNMKLRELAPGLKGEELKGKESKKLFNIILTNDDNEKIILADDDTPNEYFYELLKEYILWEDLKDEDIYVFWQWYRDGKLVPMWRAFIAYYSEGKMVYNKLFSDNLPQFLMDKFGEDKESMNKFLSSYGLSVNSLTADENK